MKRMGGTGTILAVLACLAAAGARGQEELGVEPESFYRAAVAGNPHREHAYTGEQFCWHARVPMTAFVQGYLASGDARWLEQGVRYFDMLVDRMAEGPDGYRGWIGPYIYDNEVWADVHVGDAILFDPMLRFSELVLVEEPALAERFGEAAARYVALARRNLFEKWDRRGTFREDGPFGAYVQWDHFAQPDDLSAWLPMPERRGASLSLPHNKNMDMALAALRIHRITGETWYRDRAERIFGAFKSRLQRRGDHVVWNYWEPFGTWDLDSERPGGLRHWVQVHPYRNYQAGEVGKIVQAYHYGVVFTEADVRAILNTNLAVMWNGDEANPRFGNSNLVVDPGQQRERPEDGRGRAGTLWTSLGDFSETVRSLERAGWSEPRHPRLRIVQAHARRVAHARPVGFARRFVDDDPVIPEIHAGFPRGDVASVRMAAVLPMRVAPGWPVTVIGKVNRDVTLEVAVFDGPAPDAARRAVLFRGEVEGGTDGLAGVQHLVFDGTDPETGTRLPPGDYEIRWTVPGDGHRGFPVWID